MNEIMLENLEKILEKCKEQGIDSAIDFTVELLKYKNMCLTENQITMCISIAGKNEDQFIEDMLSQNAINSSFCNKLTGFQNILSGISTVLDFADCINDIYRNVDGYVKGNIDVAPEALENYLTLLGDIVGFIPNCGLVSAQLSLATDLLAAETKIVNKWLTKYEELDKAINNVNDGISSMIDEKEVKTFYSEICQLKNGGTEDGIKFYNAMMTQYGWIFELAGIDLNKNGRFSVNTENKVYYDYSGDGFAEKTGWIEDGDGLLVYDRNNNGIIDDGSHSIRYG